MIHEENLFFTFNFSWTEQVNMDTLLHLQNNDSQEQPGHLQPWT